MKEYKYTKEEYSKLKKKELSDLYQKLDVATNDLMINEDFYMDYLKIQGTLNSYSVANCILIANQKKESKMLKTFEDWKNLKLKIKKGEKSVSIIEPYKYMGKDGVVRRSYRVKKLFDISQTEGDLKKERELTKEEREHLMEAVLEASPVMVEVVDGIDEKHSVYYSFDDDRLFTKRGLAPEDFFCEMLREQSHATFAGIDEKYERNNYDERAKAVEYMLCNRYGMEYKGNPPVFDFPELLSSKEIREEVVKIKNVMDEVAMRIDVNLDRIRESKVEKEMNEKDR